MASNELSVNDRKALAAYEEGIERGLADVAADFYAIREQRLYRDKYATFEDYCRERWNLTHRHVNNIIRAGEVIKELGTTVPKIPERHARELARAPEGTRAEVYERALERADGKPTAEDIRAVVDNEPEIVEAELVDESEVTHRAPRTDTGGVMAKVMRYTEMAALQAQLMKKSHFRNAPEATQKWHRVLTPHVEALNELLRDMEKYL